MARPWRTDFPAGIHHENSRGDRRAPTVRKVADDCEDLLGSWAQVLLQRFDTCALAERAPVAPALIKCGYSK